MGRFVNRVRAVKRMVRGRGGRLIQRTYYVRADPRRVQPRRRVAMSAPPAQPRKSSNATKRLVLRQRIKAVQARIKATRTKARQAAGKFRARVKNRIAALRSRITKLRAKRATTKARRAAIRQRIKKARERIRTVRGNARVRLQRARQRVRTRVAAHRKRIKRLRERAAALRRKREAIQRRIKKVKQAPAKAVKKAKQAPAKAVKKAKQAPAKAVSSLGHPLDSLHITGFRDARVEAEVRHALDGAAAVHKHPVVAEKIPLRGSAGQPHRSANGLINHDGMRAYHITLMERAQTSVTALHEYGHFLDLNLGRAARARPGARRHLSWSVEHNQELMDAFRNNPAYKRWERQGYSRKYLKYARSPHEMFARAYSQYISTRAPVPPNEHGHSLFQSFTERRRLEGLAHSQHPGRTIHWNDDEFGPIAAAMRRHLEHHGLM